MRLAQATDPAAANYVLGLITRVTKRKLSQVFEFNQSSPQHQPRLLTRLS